MDRMVAPDDRTPAGRAILESSVNATHSSRLVFIGAALMALTAFAGAGGEPASSAPPVPHTVDGYKTGATGNDCLTCHGAAAQAAPAAREISDDHYLHRDGVRLDRILATRVNCTQCHRPTADAKPLPAAPGGRHD